MSMDLMVKAFKTKVGNPLRKLVLIKLADNANDDGECWPSYQYIADQCEISRTTVKTHVRVLEEMGMLTREFRRKGELNQSNIFRINLGNPTPLAMGRARSALGQITPDVGQEPPEGGVGAAQGGGAGVAPGISHSFEPVIEPIIELKPICASAKPAAHDRPAKEGYSPDFETAWQIYPKRAGGNPKASAFKAWKARLKEGVKTDEMLEGVKRYAAYVRTTGNAGSQYVKQAVTFFGPDRHFEESWLAPSAPGGKRPGMLPVSGFSEQDYGKTDCNW